MTLLEFTPPGTPVVLFTDRKIDVPDTWNIKVNRTLIQMVCDRLSHGEEAEYPIKPLDASHVPAMLELTGKTNPGPFFERTIEIGNYNGIFSGDRLVAMTGERLQPDPYTEVSAVCTDPDFTGKGYAARLVRNQVRRILQNGKVAILHAYPENTGAVKLYEKIGFAVRREMNLYVMEPN